LTATIALAGFTADVGITWKPNPVNEFVTKYVVYQAKLPSTNFVAAITVVGTNFGRVRVLSPGTYQFKVSAFNGLGESPKSDAVQVPNVLATPPTNVTIISLVISNTP
jgi:hypothetical protein